MNIKINADTVTTLFPPSGNQSYDELYKMLNANLAATDNPFTKRIPGSGYLQWDLPGEGWKPLTEVDPLAESQVKTEKERLIDVVMTAFGPNRQLAQKVLTVPDDNYIYYRPNKNGGVEVKFTAWGYKYPIRINNPDIEVPIQPKEDMQEVVIKISYNGQGLPAYEFTVDSFKRVTGADGSLLLGVLPVGNTYTIDTPDGHHAQIVIVKNQRDYVIDVTVYVTVTISVSRDGAPAEGVVCRIAYWGYTTTLTTAPDGTATTTLPLDRNDGDCQVSVEDQSQQKQLLAGKPNLFAFSFTTPPQPAPNDEEKPAPDNKEQRKPDDTGEEVPDDVEKPLPDDAEKPVPDDVEEPLPDDVEEHKPSVKDGIITIRVEDENGRPMSGAVAVFSQDGHAESSNTLDDKGTTTLSTGQFATKMPLSTTITVGGQAIGPVVFELEDEENEYLLRAVVSSERNNRLLEIIAALGLMAATAATLFGVIKILM